MSEETKEKEAAYEIRQLDEEGSEMLAAAIYRLGASAAKCEGNLDIFVTSLLFVHFALVYTKGGCPECEPVDKQDVIDYFAQSVADLAERIEGQKEMLASIKTNYWECYEEFGQFEEMIKAVRAAKSGLVH